jgi:hypothetical protein
LAPLPRSDPSRSQRPSPTRFDHEASSERLHVPATPPGTQRPGPCAPLLFCPQIWLRPDAPAAAVAPAVIVAAPAFSPSAVAVAPLQHYGFWAQVLPRRCR